MSELAASVLAEGAEIQLPIPTWGFALIAAAVFGLLGFITYSFRDVATRHHIRYQHNADHTESTGQGEH